MFETIKKKAKEGKEWCVDHKQDFRDLGFYMLGATAVMVGMSIGNAIDEKNNSKRIEKNFHGETGVMKSGLTNGDHKYYCFGGTEQDYFEAKNMQDQLGVPGDAKVVSAIVYTKQH